MFHLFRSRSEDDDVEAASRRHEAAHSALIDSLRRLLEDRNRADGMTRGQES